jgi:hypothetical protein
MFNPFSDEFFEWWARKILVIEHHPYARIEFSRDPYMVVPPGTVLGEIGKLFIFFDLFNFYFLNNCICILKK